MLLTQVTRLVCDANMGAKHMNPMADLVIKCNHLTHCLSCMDVYCSTPMEKARRVLACDCEATCSVACEAPTTLLAASQLLQG